MTRYIFFVSIFFIISITLSCTSEKKEQIKDSFVTIHGKKIWYKIEGKGEPIILIPGGGGGSSDYYRPWLSALADSFQIIYYDGFGRGKSEKAKQANEYSFSRDVDEVEELRKKLGLEKIHVFGHSYGGMVAQAYAHKYQFSVNKLILANTFVSGEDWQKSNDNFNLSVSRYFPEAWQRIDSLRQKGFVANSPELQATYFGIFQPMLEIFYFYNPEKSKSIVFSENTFNAEEYYQICGPDADFTIGGDIAKLDFTQALSEIDTKTIILASRADGIVIPSLAVNLYKAIPQAEYVMFEKSGHFPFIEENENFIATIKNFLK